MPRRHWVDLPPSVRRAVEDGVGSVRRAEPVATGSVTDLAAVLHTDGGMAFCKAITTDNPQAWMHRNEIRLNPWLPPAVPRLRCTVEESGWLVLAFDYAAGHHPDLAPGSADLPAVARTLSELTAALTPCPPIPIRPASLRWAGRIAPELVDGATLLHTDVTPRNFLVGSETSVVDWSSPCRGAAWIDTALMVVRCIRAGHTPESAEAWAAGIPVWATAPPAALNAFTWAAASLYRERHQQARAPHKGELADAAARWARYRSDALSFR